MAYISSMSSLLATFLLLQPMIAASDFLAPLLSPLFDDACKIVECGKGTCKPSHNISSFFYKCECDPGWKQIPSGKDDNLQFLPCIIPNCTINRSCGATPSPVQDKSVKFNSSIFDPCSWISCGGGSCNKTSSFTYKCECAEGYYNLLNVTSFPCFKECEIGMDCSQMGVTVATNPAARAPASPKNKASSTLEESSHWLMVLIISLIMI